MIVIIKGKDYKRLIVKTLSFFSLLIMFYFYYQHMCDKFKEQNNQLVNKLNIKIDNKKIEKAKKIENIIYKEAVVVVDLLNQQQVQSVEVIKDRLLMICDYNTDIEPLMIRYGVNALIKSTSKNIKIAIDLQTIVGNKYEK